MTLNLRKTRLTVAAVFAWLILGSCVSTRPDDDSAYAASAGQATMTLGGCLKPLATGWDTCLVEKGGNMPQLRLFFLNPAEYMISDCEFGVYKSGSTPGGEVLIDMSGIDSQIQSKRLCILDVEAVESFRDSNDKTQFHKIPLIGGFYIQVIDKGYMPIPNPDLLAWCKKIKRTTKGRTIIEDCKP